MGLPRWLSGKESTCSAGDVGLILGPEDPQRRKWQPTPVFLPGKSMDRGAWWAMVYGIAKSWTQLSDEHHIESPALGARKIGKVSV